MVKKRGPSPFFVMNDFFAMGGYALYVWGAYGVTAAALAIEVLFLLKRKRETKT